MSWRAVHAVLLAVLALALPVTGCSRDGGDDTYADDANSICADVVERFPEPSSIEPGSPDADQAFRQLTKARGEAIRRLRALEPPREDAATAATMLRHLSESQRLLQEASRLG